VRDLTASLAEGLSTHVADVSARLPHASVLVQVDEPSLPAVLAGRVPTESGYGTLRAVEPADATTALADVVTAGGRRVVAHCCAPDAPIGLFRDAGVAALSLDLDQFGTALDPLGEALDAGLGLFAGAVAALGASVPSSQQIADRVKELWRTLGFSPND